MNSVAWGRSGKQLVSRRWIKRIARKGGRARNRSLTPAQRSASARKAARHGGASSSRSFASSNEHDPRIAVVILLALAGTASAQIQNPGVVQIGPVTAATVRCGSGLAGSRFRRAGILLGNS